MPETTSEIVQLSVAGRENIQRLQNALNSAGVESKAKKAGNSQDRRGRPVEYFHLYVKPSDFRAAQRVLAEDRIRAIQPKPPTPRYTIRPTTFTPLGTTMPVKGFLISGSGEATVFGTRIAVRTRETAEAVRDALKKGDRKEVDRLLRSEGVSSANARSRLHDVYAGRGSSKKRDPELDQKRKAERVAPAAARTPEDVKLQEEWYRSPNQMDFEGIDTPSVATPRRSGPRIRTRKL